MFISIKDLQQRTFKISIDDVDTVFTLKQRIEGERGKDFAVEQQKLIYAGMVLADDRTIGSYNVDENKFIVVMVSKVAANTPKPIVLNDTKSTDANTAVANTLDTTKTEAAIPATTSKGPVDPSTENATTPSTPSDNASISLEEYNRITENIMEMGYSREQVRHAMEASLNNPHRAAEYLLSGLPLYPDDISAQPSTSSAPVAEPLSFLRTQPHFHQMRQLIRQNPEFLNDVLNQIGQHDTALLQTISENQQSFLDMINEPVDDDYVSDTQDNTGTSTNNTPGTSSNTPTVPSVELQITPADREAIERLEALGFARHMVLQSYFACERNENMAANLLLSDANDDD